MVRLLLSLILLCSLGCAVQPTASAPEPAKREPPAPPARQRREPTTLRVRGTPRSAWAHRIGAMLVRLLHRQSALC